MIRNIEGSIFIAPWIFGFLVFLAFPLAYSLFMSFHHVEILPTGIELKFVGLSYYREILIDSPQLHDELLPFLREAVIMIPVILIFALLIAILLNQKFSGRIF